MATFATRKSPVGPGGYAYPNTVPVQAKSTLQTLGLSDASDSLKPSYSSASVPANGHRRSQQFAYDK